MRVCETNSERKRIQHFDSRFKQKSSNRFRIPKTNAHQSLPLRINQEVVTDPKAILTAWRDHFQTLSATNQVLSTATYSSKEEVKRLMQVSLDNEDLLDILFEPEEIDSVLKKLKLGRAAGHDGVQAEHIKYGGPTLRNWILQICNAIVELECIPDSLKIGIIKPVYKGGGKDPLDTNSHRGITLTSVFAKNIRVAYPVTPTVPLLRGRHTTSQSNGLSQRCLLYRSHVLDPGSALCICTTL